MAMSIEMNKMKNKAMNKIVIFGGEG